MTIFIKVLNAREIVLYSEEEGEEENFTLLIEESRFDGKRNFRITSLSDMKVTLLTYPPENTIINVPSHERIIIAKADDNIEKYK